MCNPPAHRWTLNKKYDHVDKSNIQYKLRLFFTFITISIFILSMMNWSIAEVHGDYEYVICDGTL